MELREVKGEKTRDGDEGRVIAEEEVLVDEGEWDVVEEKVVLDMFCGLLMEIC